MTDRGRFALSPGGAACWGAAVVAYVLVLLTGDGWLLAVAAAGLVLPLVDLVLACRGGGLALRRPTRAVAGASTPVRAERVAGPGPEGDLQLTVFAAAGPARLRVHAGCDAAVLSVPAGPRGPMAPLRWMADTYGPLGLAARRRHGRDATPVLVHPAAAAALTVRPAAGEGGEGRLLRVAAGVEPAGVRAWRPGDPARTVHARATARRGVPVVRESQTELGRGLVVAAGRFGPAEEERLAQVAATALAALEAGTPVVLLGGGEQGVPADRAALLDWFALLAPGPADLGPAGAAGSADVLWVGAPWAAAA